MFHHAEEAGQAVGDAAQDGTVSGGGGAGPGRAPAPAPAHGSLLQAPQAAVPGGGGPIQPGRGALNQKHFHVVVYLFCLADPVWGLSLLLVRLNLPEDTRRWSFGDPYLGEQQGLSMRPWTLSSDVEICRVRAEASGEVVLEDGRGDQALLCKAIPLVPGRSVWRPTLTLCDEVWVDREDMLTIWVENESESEEVWSVPAA